jgi:hypothetical protein
VLLPCALLAALGVKVLLTASVLVGWEVIDSLNLIWTQASKHGMQERKLLLPSAVSDFLTHGLCLGALLPPAKPAASPACVALSVKPTCPCCTLPRLLPPACPPQLSLLVLQGMAPNELVVKRLAMMGCTGVHAACSVVMLCPDPLPCSSAVLLCLAALHWRPPFCGFPVGAYKA